jgi:two-component system, OmpR family, response regulator RegX3
MRVLVVDDDRELVDLLTFTLRRGGFDVSASSTAGDALRLLMAERPDIAVLDVNLGPMDGFELLRQIRLRSDIPVMMLTGRDAEEDRVRGLDLGADDYVVKPFSHRELLARLRAHMRRAGKPWVPAAPETVSLEVGPLRLDRRTHAVTHDGRSLDLTITEFRLLQYLMQNAGTVVATETLMRNVWGDPNARRTDVVRVTIHRLRRKLGDETETSRLVRTISGVGVILAHTPEPVAYPL